MKCSEQWLRVWANPSLTRQALCDQLTMAGFEIEEQIPALSESDDYILDFSITPNRGDCLSIQGLAREIAALTQATLTPVPITDVKAQIDDIFPVTLAHSGCGHYIGRVIRDVNAEVETPLWIKERLSKSDIRTISAIVDITNYVMLELGQPMHAFDLAMLNAGITVRLSTSNESIELLDGTMRNLDIETLIIADAQQPLAIAGIMGGLSSSVTLNTQDIFLESAFFSPSIIAKQRQRYGLQSDSAYRFERGVDPQLQAKALARATQLILEIAGGKAGPVIEITHPDFNTTPSIILLKSKTVASVLGITIPDQDIESIFDRLQFVWHRTEENELAWQITVPSHRFDVRLPEDVIEEIARLFGYDHIPTLPILGELNTAISKTQPVNFDAIRLALAHDGFSEIITYSFIESAIQALFDPNEKPKALLNPISNEMGVMRTNLWPGLVNTYIYNHSRQQQRIRLFEIGLCFTEVGEALIQKPRLAGLIAGNAFPEQWGLSERPVDFYDLKGHVEVLLEECAPLNQYQFKPATHPALHPGQCAAIYYQDKCIGLLGAIHPTIKTTLQLTQTIYLFELDLEICQHSCKQAIKDVSKFPDVRRDIAILVNRTIPVEAIQDTIVREANELLQQVFVFDVYQGKGIPDELKSIAFALIFQHPTRTLVEEEINAAVDAIILRLTEQLGAQLRR